MWNRSVSLPVKEWESQNSEGYTKKEHQQYEAIPAKFSDITRNDEILANQKGYTADQNIEIMACNYDGQSWLVDEATREVYDIRRTYHREGSLTIILTCERRQHGAI